jgi:hypothetical protein
MQPILTILEGKWFDRKNVTVLDLFKPLFTLWPPPQMAGERAYHYEMFTNESAFCDAVARAFRTNSALTVYLAAHGDPDGKGLQGFHDDGISRTVIRNALQSAPTARRRGVFFGACSFGTEANAKYILSSCNAVDWIAGYQTEADWLDSTVLDLLFLKHYLYPSQRGRAGNPETSDRRLRFAVKRVAKQMGGLATALRFSVYRRRKGRGDNVDDIMSEALELREPPR